MAQKSVPISFRISPEVAAFIAQLKIAGAATPSEKIRELIARAQREHASGRTFKESAANMREALAPSLADLQEAERDLERHSELIRVVYDWLPEAMAILITATPVVEGEPSLTHLQRLERDLADRAVRLLESVLRMAVTRQVDAYDPDLLSGRLDRVLELASLIATQRDRDRERPWEREPQIP